MLHHDKYSPSSLPALALCKHYRPSNVETEESSLGNLLHDIVTHLYNNKSNFDGVITDSELAKKVLELPLHDIESCQYCLDQIDNLMTTQEKGEQLITNETVHIIDDNFNELTFGTPDFFNKFVFIDLKFGEEHDYLAQLQAYALGIMQRYSIKEIIGFTIYGRLKKYRKCDFAYDNCMRSLLRIINNTDERKHKNEWCKYCADFLTCEAQIENVNQLVAGYIPTEEQVQINQWHPSKITNPEDMEKLLNVKTQLEKWVKKWCDSVNYHAKEMLNNGAKIPGYELKSKSGGCEVGDILKAYQLSGISQEEFLKCCKVSIPDLTEKISEGKNTKEKRLIIENRLSGVIVHKEPVWYIKKVKEPSAKIKTCEECGIYPADTPSNLCCGCDSYKSHF